MAYGETLYTVIIGDDGVIWDMSSGRKRQALGVDRQVEEEFKKALSEQQEVINEYCNKLIEIRKYLIKMYNDKDMVNQLSAFEIKKTPEEIAQETANEQLRIIKQQNEQQTKINEALLNAFTNLQIELKELKSNGDCRHGDKLSTEQIRNDSPKVRKKPGRNKTSATSGETNFIAESE